MKKIVVFIAIVGILASCTDSDESSQTDLMNQTDIESQNNVNNQVEDKLSYSWSLLSVTCLCEPINLEVGEHIWEFDTTESVVNITNNVSENLHPLLDSGTYNIVVTTDTIVFEGIEYNYHFEDDKLFLDYLSHADGFLFEFVREE